MFFRVFLSVTEYILIKADKPESIMSGQVGFDA
ncbi:protein of unknown function [Maridesulfovibrio hydrothermalis AM13 = DSM 14728]|uniref:Uncharacterized protein n=1 Tax=Maridesulfovibrio hydrothermalis AM13 = DSM 14728 TaxID=1121451 RepID=L0RD28_9BACT|nr:protein of unknown function [Maridesulfovibrio hydrothermalis AM13 = DSM 14728]